ncbi:ankyrin-2 ankyrin [Colletotrichum truncatum]|uniref:Ankyrin-2 ankyrin n=1 Tax=Colletotrichum truncatum TaxID=5467 RepID=A0ACC3YY39_COLTU|nr:ankyrin-2 ankyrin [Colletotrichum truncatum]KAF6790832.1 ankyrin-2 ankyrin [Colletotrichum truncatum]
MEPKGVVDSLRGLVAVTDAAFRQTFDFAKDNLARGIDSKRRAEIREIADEIQDMAGMLHRLCLLAYSFEDMDLMDDWYGIRALAMPPQLISCHQTLDRLGKTLSKKKLAYAIQDLEEDGMDRQLKWPFTKAWTADLLQELTVHKHAISKALTANSMNELLLSFSSNEKKDNSFFEVRDYTRGRCVKSPELYAVVHFFSRLGQNRLLIEELKGLNRLTRYPLLESQVFESWIQTPNSKLWLTGPPGVGKTTFAAAMIEKAIHKLYNVHNIAVAFVFCKSSDPRTHDPFHIVSTLLSRVARQHPLAISILEQYFKELNRKRMVDKPTIERMKAIFLDVSRHFKQVLVVADGVNECAVNVVAITETLDSLSSQSGNMSLAVVSRHQPDIQVALGEGFQHIQIEASTDQLELVAATNVENAILSGNLALEEPRMKDEVISKLSFGCEASFLQIPYQIDHLSRLISNKERNEFLEQLPNSLEETYKLALRQFNRQPPAVRGLVQAAFQLATFVDPPLTILEMCQALSVACIPSLDADLLEYPEVDETEILNQCGLFLKKSADKQCFELSHHTFKEFLESIEPSDPEFSDYRLSETRTKRLLAMCALRYLCLGHFSRLPARTNSEEKFIQARNYRYPFYRYASLMWPQLANELWHDAEFLGQAMELCDLAQTANFKSWCLEVCRFYRLDGSLRNWMNDRCDERSAGRSRRYLDMEHGSSVSDSLWSDSTQGTTGSCSSPSGISEESSSNQERRKDVVVVLSTSWQWRRRAPHWKWRAGQTRRLAHFTRRGDFTPLHMASLLGLSGLCHELLKHMSDVNQISRMGSPLQCALGGPFLVACHDFYTRKDSKDWAEQPPKERPSMETIRVLVTAGADCTRPLPTHYSWDSMGALALKSSEWASDYEPFALVVRGGAQMHDDAIDLFRSQCRKWNKHKSQSAMSNITSILELLTDLVAKEEGEASAYLKAFQKVVTDTTDIDTQLPVSAAVTDEMLVEAMWKAIENDSMNMLKEIAENPHRNLELQEDALTRLLDFAVSCLSISCLDYMLTSYVDSREGDNRKEKMVLDCFRDRMEDALVCLLHHGAKTIHTDDFNDTIWHLANDEDNNLRIVRVLLSRVEQSERDIALRMTNKNGLTPLAVALDNASHEVAIMIIGHCQGDQSCLKSSNPPLNKIIASIKSVDVLKKLHAEGLLLKSSEETPLHCLDRFASADCVRQLLVIYPYSESLAWKSPLACFLEASQLYSYNEAILKELISADLALPTGKTELTIWSLVFNILRDRYRHLHNTKSIPSFNIQVEKAPEVVKLMIDTGCLGAHEQTSGTSGLKEVENLLSCSNIPLNSKINPEVVSILEEIFVLVFDATGDSNYLKSSGMDVKVLKWAIVCDSVFMVDRLLCLGADIHERVLGMNAIEFACAHGGNPNSHRILVKLLENANREALNELTPTNSGEKFGLFHLLGLADCFSQTPWKTPSFGFAIQNPPPNLPHGMPPPPPPIPRGFIPLSQTGGYARHRRPMSCVKIRLVQQLLDENLDPTIVSKQRKNSPLILHIIAGCFDSARLLLRRGADKTLNHSDVDGWTAASWACVYGWIELLEEMVPLSASETMWNFRVKVSLARAGANPITFNQAAALHLATIGSAETVAFLLDHDYAKDINATTSDGSTALHFATLLGQVDSIKLLVSRGANVNAQNNEGFAPLHLAVTNQNECTTRLLLELGAKHLVVKKGKTPLDMALLWKNKNITDMIRKSIRGSLQGNLDQVADRSYYRAALSKAMQYAIERADVKTCERLLEEGCSPNIKMRSCRTCSALLFALRSRVVSVEIVQCLIDKGASFRGVTCRRHACGYCCYGIRNWSEGEDSDTSSSAYSSSDSDVEFEQEWPTRGSTALDLLMYDSDLEEEVPKWLRLIPQDELIWLIDNSAPAQIAINRESKKSLTALFAYLEELDRTTGRKLVRQVATQVTTWYVYNRNTSTLHAAAIENDIEMAKLLIKHGADINAMSQSCGTPLHVATDKENLTMITLLLDKGAAINIRDGHGHTPLQLAARENNVDAMELLVNRGARIDRSEDSNTLLMFGKTQTLPLLMKAGMSLNQRGCLGIPIWATALFNSDIATFIVNSDFSCDLESHYQGRGLWKVWWQVELFDNKSSMHKALRLFHRRMGVDFIRRLTEVKGDDKTFESFSLLCFSAHYGRLREVQELLRIGLDMEFEGSTAGTPLLAAAHEGRVDVVKLLVYRGAKVLYKKNDVWKSALDAAKSFPGIVDWLLVGRFTEQGKLEACSSNWEEDYISRIRPWSGVHSGVFLLEGKYQKAWNESTLKWLCSLEKAKRKFQGKVVVSELWDPKTYMET